MQRNTSSRLHVSLSEVLGYRLLTLISQEITGLSGFTSPDRGMTDTFRTTSSLPPLPSRSKAIPG
jgi:hypothetical protein